MLQKIDTQHLTEHLHVGRKCNWQIKVATDFRGETDKMDGKSTDETERERSKRSIRKMLS